MRWMEPTEEQVNEWRAWVAERPENVRTAAERFDPWTLYQLKDAGHRVTLHSFQEAEDGVVTLTVLVSGAFNFVIFDRQVFGIDPDSLAECDLPPAEEPLGTLVP